MCRIPDHSQAPDPDLTGPATGKPYLDVSPAATVTQGNRQIRVPGFHDGGSVYRIRFTPDSVGAWSYETASSAPELAGTAAAKGAHGPVRVANQFHFACADGTPYFSFGTTCYAWTHKPLALQAETLNTLETAGFNKIHMGVFPKDYPFNTNEPLLPIYLGEHRPQRWTVGLQMDDGVYEVDVIDAWAMTVTPATITPAIVPHPIRHMRIVSGKPDAAFGVDLPGKSWLAIRVRPKRQG